MSAIKKVNVFHSAKRKKQEEENRFVRMTGIKINGNPVLKDNNKLLFLLTNALLNFLVAIGAAGSFLESFSIRANMAVICIAAAVIALFTAFLYYNNIVKTLGYLLAFSGFIYGIFHFRYLIKGGFGYICNKIMEFLEKEFALPVERSYDVYGYGEMLSVTVCTVFIMFAVMLLFNMAITETKGFVIVFLFTFPIVQAGMYFDLKINIIYFAIYMSGILGLFFLRNSRHYHMESKRKNGYRKHKRKNSVEFDYTNDGKQSFYFVITISSVLILIMLLLSIAYPLKKFRMDDEYSSMKENTRDFTQKLALVGFWGMFNPDGSAGGVGRSRLGQSKYVKLDYETDLIVKTMVEADEESIYLKAFNGTFYKDEYWETISEHKENKIRIEDYGIETEKLNTLTKELSDIYSLDYAGYKKRIEVVNVAATSSFSYIPYYSANTLEKIGKLVNDDEFVGGLPRNYIQTIRYLPLNRLESVDEFRDYIKKENDRNYTFAKEYGYEEDIEYLELEKKYSQYVYDMYMEVPGDNKKVIEDFCKKYELNPKSEDIVEKVAAIFERDYEYTLMPGRTPKGEEFVNYFLSESKKGYCTYFATSAVLIFRHLGIPARYAGGYVLQSADFQSGTKLPLKDDTTVDEEDENGVDTENDNDSGMELYSEWTNRRRYDEELYPYGLNEYELDDSSAHAWVEIYIDGFGWLPVETTPSSDETEEEEKEPQNNNLMDFFTNTLFTPQNISNVRKASVSLFFMIITGAFLMVLIYIITGIFIRIKRRRQTNVNGLYEYMKKCLAVVGIKKGVSQSYEEYAELILETDILDEKSINKIMQIIERERFSQYRTRKEDIEYMSETVIKLSDKIYASLKWYKKFVYRYIKWL